MRIRNLAAAAFIGVAALGVSGCATSLPTKVTRYSVAIPQGQSFYVVPAQGVQSGLEFNRYAALVAEQMAARGYRQAASTAAASVEPIDDVRSTAEYRRHALATIVRRLISELA